MVREVLRTFVALVVPLRPPGLLVERRETLSQFGIGDHKKVPQLKVGPVGCLDRSVEHRGDVLVGDRVGLVTADRSEGVDRLANRHVEGPRHVVWKTMVWS